MKKNKLLICLLIGICLLTSCSKKKNNKNPGQTESKLPAESVEFVEYVNQIVITTDAQAQIDTAFEMYENLGEDSWNYDEVLNAYDELCELEQTYYALLDDIVAADGFIDKVAQIPAYPNLDTAYLVTSARNTYDSLSEKAKKLLGVDLNLEILVKYEKIIDELRLIENNKVLEEEATPFISACRTLKEAESIRLSDKDALDACQSLYENLSADAKKLESVIKAYDKLTSCIERYDYLCNHPEVIDEINRDSFIKLMELVPAVVTLDDIIVIKDAELAYRDLTASQKSEDEIITLSEKLKTARIDYNTLYFAKYLEDECGAFMALMDEIITPITKESGPALKAAKNAYPALSAKAKENTVVVEAYQQLTNYLEEFNQLDIAQIDSTLSAVVASGSATTINPTLTLKNIKSELYVRLKNLYNVSATMDLEGKCNLILVVYKLGEGAPLFEGDITKTLLADTDRITKSEILRLFQNASATSKEVVSGQYSFGIRVVDLTGEYRDSDIFVPTQNVSANYSFDSLYVDTYNKEVIQIRTLEDFLNIKNDLAGNYALVNDIDTSSIPWENLGIFSGILNGNGHTISGLNCEIGPKDAFGIFLEITATGIVENLSITGNVKNAGTNAGVIAVTNRGLIRNCFLNLEIHSLGETINGENTGDACIGGVVSENLGTISNVVSVSVIEGAGTIYGFSLDGGICIKQNGQIQNCFVLIDNVSTKQVIGNNGNIYNECAKTQAELLKKSLYNSFDEYLWEIIDGYLPELRISEV